MGAMNHIKTGKCFHPRAALASPREAHTTFTEGVTKPEKGTWVKARMLI